MEISCSTRSQVPMEPFMQYGPLARQAKEVIKRTFRVMVTLLSTPPIIVRFGLLALIPVVGCLALALTLIFVSINKRLPASTNMSRYGAAAPDMGIHLVFGTAYSASRPSSGKLSRPLL